MIATVERRKRRTNYEDIIAYQEKVLNMYKGRLDDMARENARLAYQYGRLKTQMDEMSGRATRGVR